MYDDPQYEFPVKADTVANTLSELYRHQNNNMMCEILDNSSPRIELIRSDSWKGGTDYYTLFLELPLKLFASIEKNITKLETAIASTLPRLLGNTGSSELSSVQISATLEPGTKTNKSIFPIDVEHLWQNGKLKLFLSHISTHKKLVSMLKAELLEYGISSFIAHEDIEPTREWQKEIQLALHSMDALVAILTSDFHGSLWTDHEVGFALGKNTLVIPVRAGLDPYGLLGKIQALSGQLSQPSFLASKIVDLLAKNNKTEAIMRESLVYAIENARWYTTSINASRKLTNQKIFTSEQIYRLEKACKTNDQVYKANGVCLRIQEIINKHK